MAKLAVDTLPLVGRDQGWGWIGPNIGALAPPPTSPIMGEVPSGARTRSCLSLYAIALSLDLVRW